MAACQNQVPLMQVDHLSGNVREFDSCQGNVREFDSCQGNVREFTKNLGNVRRKNLGREKLPKTI